MLNSMVSSWRIRFKKLPVFYLYATEAFKIINNYTTHDTTIIFLPLHTVKRPEVFKYELNGLICNQIQLSL